MKYSTATIPVCAVASLAASIETRQNKKLPWTQPVDVLDQCGRLAPITEYWCGTEKFCNMINNPNMQACENPQGWKSPKQCLDAHEAKPSKEKCDNLRKDAFDKCRENSEFQECVTKGHVVYKGCMGYQKEKSATEIVAELRAKGCEV